MVSINDLNQKLVNLNPTYKPKAETHQQLLNIKSLKIYFYGISKYKTGLMKSS